MKTWQELKAANEQPAPVANDRPAVWPLVVEDMKARDAVGRQRYGVPLQPNNGRDALRDAYEEALDLAVYLKQALLENGDQLGSRIALAGKLSRLEEENKRLRNDLERVALERDEAREEARKLKGAVAMAEAQRDAAISGESMANAFKHGAHVMRQMASIAPEGVSRVSPATAYRVGEAILSLPLPEMK